MYQKHQTYILLNKKRSLQYCSQKVWFYSKAFISSFQKTKDLLIEVLVTKEGRSPIIIECQIFL